MRKFTAFLTIISLLLVLGSCAAAPAPAPAPTGGESAPPAPTAEAAAPTPAAQEDPAQTPGEPAPVWQGELPQSSVTPEMAVELIAELELYDALKDYTFEDVELVTLDGERANTADFRGKVLLVNLLATWCGYCVQELPYFAQGVELYGQDGPVQLVFIQTFEDVGSAAVKNDMLSMLSDAGLDDPLVLLDEGSEYGYNVNPRGAIPYTMIVDAQGQVRVVWKGAFSSADQLIMLTDLVLHYSDLM